jgi:hypothetical protein
MFRGKPEDRAEKDARKQQAAAEKEQQRREQEAAQQRAAYLASPVGRAQTAYQRGDQVFQFEHDVMSQQAIIVAMVGSSTGKTTADPSEILNAVCAQGWELINGSFVFIHEGEQSRDKLLSSGQNVAIKGRTVGYYLFRRAEQSPQALGAGPESLMPRQA